MFYDDDSLFVLPLESKGESEEANVCIKLSSNISFRGSQLA